MTVRPFFDLLNSIHQKYSVANIHIKPVEIKGHLILDIRDKGNANLDTILIEYDKDFHNIQHVSSSLGLLEDLIGIEGLTGMNIQPIIDLRTTIYKIKSEAYVRLNAIPKSFFFLNDVIHWVVETRIGNGDMFLISMKLDWKLSKFRLHPSCPSYHLSEARNLEIDLKKQRYKYLV